MMEIDDDIDASLPRSVCDGGDPIKVHLIVFARRGFVRLPRE